GYLVEPYLIQRVTDLEGRVLFEENREPLCSNCVPMAAAEAPVEREPSLFDALDEDELPAGALERPQPVVDPGAAFIVDTMLREVRRRGTAGHARALKRADLAGKTATTNGPSGVWFSGDGGGIVTTDWVGFDQYHQVGRSEYAS